MNKIISWAGFILAIVAILISLGSAVGGSKTASFGGVTNYDDLALGSASVSTTTLYMKSTSTTGSCLQLQNIQGQLATAVLSNASWVIATGTAVCK